MARDDRFTPAARRWLVRFIDETRASLSEALVAGASLAELEVRPKSAVARYRLEQLLDETTS